MFNANGLWIIIIIMVSLLHHILVRFSTALILLGISLAAPQNPPPLSNWLQFGFDPQHSGNNPLETTLTISNVNSLKRMIQMTLPGIADGAPVFLSSVTTSTGIRNLVFVTTQNGYIVALDADSGSLIWSHQNSAGSCRINNATSVCYTTSSPAIDPNLQYVYSYGLDGKVHKYQVGDGVEITSGGWPEVASLKPNQEKGSSALSFATDNGTTYLYAANGGYPGDQGDYQGHLTAINLATGAQKVFNTVCSNQAVHFVETSATPDCSQVQTAIWARPGVVYNPENNRIYMATGNGTYDPSSFDWGDTVFALNPDGSGTNGGPLDSYTPADFATLQAADADLGSTAPAILPTPANSLVKHLAVQGGKDALLRLINLDNLSGMGGPGHTGGEIGTPIGVPQGGAVLTQPAVWVDPANSQTWVFVANSNGISGLKLVVDGGGNPSLSLGWQKANGGTSPVIADGILFYAGSGLIQALNPLTGATLWSDSTIGSIHWASPIVINGLVYISDQASHLTVFSLNGKIPGLNDQVYLPVIMR